MRPDISWDSHGTAVPCIQKTTSGNQIGYRKCRKFLYYFTVHLTGSSSNYGDFPLFDDWDCPSAEIFGMLLRIPDFAFFRRMAFDIFLEFWSCGTCFLPPILMSWISRCCDLFTQLCRIQICKQSIISHQPDGHLLPKAEALCRLEKKCNCCPLIEISSHGWRACFLPVKQKPWKFS